MNRIIGIFFTVLLVVGLTTTESCKSKDEVTGSLTVTVMNRQGQVIPNEPVSIATSLGNVSNKIFLYTANTDANGSIIFRQLTPQYYWYTTEHFKGFGAAQVFATVDSFVILIVEPLEPALK